MARGNFGLSSRGRGNFRGGSNTRVNFRGRGSFKRGRGGSSGASGSGAPPPVRGDDGSQLEERFERVKLDDEVDEKLGFMRISEGPKREGWLVNMHPVSGPGVI